MKNRRKVFSFVFFTVVFLAFFTCSGPRIRKNFDALAETDAVFPVEGKPDTYLVSPRYDRIDRVMFSANRSAGEGTARVVEIPVSDWKFTPGDNLLVVNRIVDRSVYRVVIRGKRTAPYTIAERVPIVADSIRVAVAGRVAEPGKDFFFDEKANTITVPSLREPYQIRFRRTDKAVLGYGDFSPEKMTKTLAGYFGFPTRGNVKPVPGKKRVYDTRSESFRKVWRVDLLPAADNGTGVTLDDSDWSFDSVAQELSIGKQFDGAALEVYALGDADGGLSTTGAVPFPGADGAFEVPSTLRFRPMRAMIAISKLEIIEYSGAGSPVTETLDPRSWSFDPSPQVITLNTPVGRTGAYLAVTGKVGSPLTFLSTKSVDPGSVRLVPAGRIGKEGTDYRLEAGNTAIVILAPDYGTDPKKPEVFSFRMEGSDYGTTESNIGPGTQHAVAPSIIRHVRDVLFVWDPVSGARGSYAVASGRADFTFRRLSIVETASIVEGKTGRLLASDEYSFDPATQVLTLKTPIDDREFIVSAWGEY